MEKVISPPKGEMMPMTEEHFFRVIGLHDDMIHEQRIEIGKLKNTINKLRQRNDRLNVQLEVYENGSSTP